MDLSLFEKVEIKAGRGTSMPNTVSLKTKGAITFSADLVRTLGWQADDRVDLYKFGCTYAVKKNPVGVIRLAKSGKNSIRINNLSAYLQVKAFVKEEYLEAWVENGVLFFRGTPIA